MKNLWKKLIITLALVLVMSAVPAQAHAADALAGAFLQVGLQAAGINFLQSWGSLTGLDAAKTAIARDLTDLFNSWAVAASKPYTTVQEFFEYYYPSQSWITVLSNFFKNPVTELYKAAIYINSNDIISALSDFAAWVKTEKFGTNADSDGGTTENPVLKSQNALFVKSSRIFVSEEEMFYTDEIRFTTGNSSDKFMTVSSNIIPSYVPEDKYSLSFSDVYNYFALNPSSMVYTKKAQTLSDGRYFLYHITKTSATSDSVLGILRVILQGEGSSSTLWNWNASQTSAVEFKANSSRKCFIMIGYNTQVARTFFVFASSYISATTGKVVHTYGNRKDSNVDFRNSPYQWGSLPFSNLDALSPSDFVSYSIQYQNTNNNQLPATIPSGETTVITPSGLTVIQSMTQAMAEQQVTINDLTYEIGALREQLDQQTTVIGQNTVLIGDLFDALDAVKVPVSDLSTAAAAIQAAESAANDTGQIAINGVPYTLEEILTALASSTVTITDDEEEQHLVPADTVVGQILDTDLTPEAIANGIISVPVVEDTDGATVAPSVNVVTQTITVPVPTTAPTVGPTAIPTEGILPTVMPTGGVTAVPTTIPGETEVEAIQALPEAIASAIANIFVPDAELITGIYNTINGKFAFIQQMANFLNQILSVQEEIPAIYIYPHNKGATSILEYAPADVERILVLDMTWYVPYRETVNNIISGFLWLAFLWAFWKRIPGIISGASVITDKYAYSHREWGE